MWPARGREWGVRLGRDGRLPRHPELRFPRSAHASWQKNELRQALAVRGEGWKRQTCADISRMPPNL